MAVKVIHHPGEESDFVISEPEGGRVVIKLPEHAANIILAEFEFVLLMLRLAVEDEAGRVRARAYLEQGSSDGK